MRLVTALAAALLIGLPSTSTAATPVSPASGSAFTTIDEVAFRATAAPDEPAYWFFFSAGRVFNPNRYFSVPGDGDGSSVRLDLGFLATKFDHLGDFAWSVAQVAGSDYEPASENCSVAHRFSVSFRLAPLTRRAARSDTRWVMSHHFRPYWRGFSGRRVACRPVTRTRRWCRISGFAGDSVLTGR